MGRRRLRLFIRICKMKNFKGFSTLSNGNMEIYTPRYGGRDFNPEFEKLYMAYEKFQGRQYKGYKDCKYNLRNAILKSREFEVISFKEKRLVFREKTVAAQGENASYSLSMASTILPSVDIDENELYRLSSMVPSPLPSSDAGMAPFTSTACGGNSFYGLSTGIPPAVPSVDAGNSTSEGLLSGKPFALPSMDVGNSASDGLLSGTPFALPSMDIGNSASDGLSSGTPFALPSMDIGQTGLPFLVPSPSGVPPLDAGQTGFTSCVPSPSAMPFDADQTELTSQIPSPSTLPFLDAGTSCQTGFTSYIPSPSAMPSFDADQTELTSPIPSPSVVSSLDATDVEQSQAGMQLNGLQITTKTGVYLLIKLS